MPTTYSLQKLYKMFDTEPQARHRNAPAINPIVRKKDHGLVAAENHILGFTCSLAASFQHKAESARVTLETEAETGLRGEFHSESSGYVVIRMLTKLPTSLDDFHANTFGVFTAAAVAAGRYYSFEHPSSPLIFEATGTKQIDKELFEDWFHRNSARAEPLSKSYASQADSLKEWHFSTEDGEFIEIVLDPKSTIGKLKLPLIALTPMDPKVDLDQLR